MSYKCMKVYRPGFTLIEIIIALLVSSMVAMIILRTFRQTTTTFQRVTTLIDDNAELLGVYAQLERDLSGAFVPAVWKEAAVRDVKEEEEAAKVAAQQSKDIKATKKELGEQAVQQATKRPVFSTEVKEGNLTQFSFVTTNAFVIFDEPAARAVRVTYKLVEQTQEEAREKRYRLMREETPYVAEGAVYGRKRQTRSYPLLINITSLTGLFSALEEKTSDKDKKASSEFVSLSEWGTEAQKKKSKRLMPEWVKLTGTVISPVSKKSLPFTFQFHIPSLAQQAVHTQTSYPLLEGLLGKIKLPSGLQQPGKQQAGAPGGIGSASVGQGQGDDN